MVGTGNCLSTIVHAIFVANSGFRGKWSTMGEFQLFFFKMFCWYRVNLDFGGGTGN